MCMGIIANLALRHKSCGLADDPPTGVVACSVNGLNLLYLYQNQPLLFFLLAESMSSPAVTIVSVVAWV